MSNRARELEALAGPAIPSEVTGPDGAVLVVDPCGDQFFWWVDGEVEWAPTTDYGADLELDHGDTLGNGYVLVRCRREE